MKWKNIITQILTNEYLYVHHEFWSILPIFEIRTRPNTKTVSDQDLRSNRIRSPESGALEPEPWNQSPDSWALDLEPWI